MILFMCGFISQHLRMVAGQLISMYDASDYIVENCIMCYNLIPFWLGILMTSLCCKKQKHGTDFGTLYTMADENHENLSKCKSNDIKDVEFFIVETE